MNTRIGDFLENAGMWMAIGMLWLLGVFVIGVIARVAKEVFCFGFGC